MRLKLADVFLRFRCDDGSGKRWLRRHLWCLGYGRTPLLELATSFESEADAIAFTVQYRLSDQLELVTVQAKEARRGA